MDQEKNHWPKWPQYTSTTEARVRDVFESGRWAISGNWTGSTPKEQEFAQKFAAWNGVPFCVPVDHGSSSLLIALEALDIGAGDEVIVPALTWVATATAVLNVNAAPVFVDIERDSCCISPEAIEKAITAQTRAILVVHLHCTMADMDRILKIAEAHNLHVIEDCAQAHGAIWSGSRAGSLGIVGCFSTQQGKVLTSGEGGAVITSDERLYRRMQQLRADAREYCAGTPAIGTMQLTETAEVMGSNHCLSEFHAAILLDQMERLDEQNLIREENAAWLDQHLAELGGITPIRRSPKMERRSIYKYAVRVSPAAFGDASTAALCSALSSGLACTVYRSEVPLPRNPLYCPWTKRRFALLNHPHTRPEVRDAWFPEAEAAHRELVLFHHSILLGTKQQMEEIVGAFRLAQHSFSSLITATRT